MKTRRPSREQLRRQIRGIINESLQETYGVRLPLRASTYYSSPITEQRIRNQTIYLCEGLTPGLGTGVTTFGSVLDSYDKGRISANRMWQLMETSYQYEWDRIWQDDDLDLLSEGFFGSLGDKADKFFATAAAGVKKAAGVAGQAMAIPGKVAGAAVDVAKGAAKGAYNALPDAVKKKIEALMEKVVGFFEKMWDQAVKMAEKHLPTFTKIVRKMIAFNDKFKTEHPLLHMVISKLIFMLIVYGAISLLTGGAGAAAAGAKGAAGKAAAAKGAGAAKAAAAASDAASVADAAGAAKVAAGAGKAKAAAAAADAASAADAVGGAKTAAAAAKTAKAAKVASAASDVSDAASVADAAGAAKAAKAAKVAKAAKIAKAKKLAMAKKAAAAAKGKAAGGTLSNAKVKALKGLLDSYSQSNPGMSDQALEAIKLIQNAAADGTVTTKEIDGMGKMAKVAFKSINKVVAEAQAGDPVTQKYLLKLTKLGGRVVVK